MHKGGFIKEQGQDLYTERAALGLYRVAAYIFSSWQGVRESINLSLSLSLFKDFAYLRVSEGEHRGRGRSPLTAELSPM